MTTFEMHDDDSVSGDPRRCPRHPHVTTSSPDGMFDAPCDECEHAADREEDVVVTSEDCHFFEPLPDDGLDF